MVKDLRGREKFVAQGPKALVAVLIDWYMHLKQRFLKLHSPIESSTFDNRRRRIKKKIVLIIHVFAQNILLIIGTIKKHN